MDSLRNHPDSDVARAGAPALINKLIHAVIPLLILMGMPLMSNAATLIHHPTEGYVTSIKGLDVNGTLYDATFHLGKTFNDLWFSITPGGLFDRNPLFWGNSGLAAEAGNAIMTVLGSSERTSEVGDRFLVPWEFHVPAGVISSAGDRRAEVDVDELETALWVPDHQVPTTSPYVSFEPFAIPLSNGLPATGLSTPLGGELRFTLEVPAGATGLSFQISGGSGDADLYVQFGSAPTLGSYNCRPYSEGNNETCTMPNAAEGTWHVLVHGFSAFAGVSLVGSYAAGDVLDNGIPATGLAAPIGGELRFTLEVPADATDLNFQISGGKGDADLYVQFGSAPTLYSYDCRPYIDGNNETCTMPSATAGTWHVLVHGYSAFIDVSLVGSYSESDNWREAAKLLAGDGAADDQFGWSVAIAGDTAVIGASRDDDLGLGSGAAYVFTRDATGSWHQQAKLTASDGAAGDSFGLSVALAGDTVVISASGDDTNNFGAAYVFTRDTTGSWHQQAKLTASNGTAQEFFGRSVAVAGDTAVIGAYQDGRVRNAGAAYVFTRDATGRWRQQAKLTAADGARGDRFGTSVAVAGNMAVIGASQDSDLGSSSGAAYVFERDATGRWRQQAKLIAADGARGDFFGISVAVAGDTTVIGAYGDGDNESYLGSAYVFTRNVSGRWRQEAKLTASDGAASDGFGFSVALSGNMTIIGAFRDNNLSDDSGAAYVFTRDATGSWHQQAKLTASDSAAADFFGHSVAVAGNTAVIGAYGDDDNGSFSGSAYVFGLTGARILDNGVPATNLTAPTGGELRFTLEVPTGATGLNLQLSGGSGDADLYVQFGTPPTVDSYDCRPYVDGNEETCTMPSATAGTWHVLVRGFSVFTDVSLVGSYIETGALDNGAPATGLSGSIGDELRFTLEIPAGATDLNFQLSGGSGDADLYVQFGSPPTLDSYDCRPYVDSNDETCAMPDATEGTWYVLVHGFSAFTNVSLAGSYSENGNWREVAKLLAKPQAGGWFSGQFGNSVAVSGDTVLIGAELDDNPGLDSGSAYVFVRDTNGAWSQQIRLTADDGANFDHFGFSVAVDGDTAAIGAYQHQNLGTSGIGAVYVFERDTTGNWSQRFTITSASNLSSNFGWSVAVAGDTIVIGDPLDDAGAAYVSTRDAFGRWRKPVKLTASDGTFGDRFGVSVALSGDTVLIGAELDDDLGLDSGSAYVFERDANGAWSQQAKLTAAEGASFDAFGQSLAVFGNTAVIGADRVDNFGSSAAAYVFERDVNDAWVQQAKLTASDDLAATLFRQSVALAGDTAVLGTSWNQDNGTGSGAAYVFERNTDGTWNRQAKLTASDGAAGDGFGFSVALATDNTLVIGAFRDDDNAPNAGSAYVFGLDNLSMLTNGVPVTGLTAPTDGELRFTLEVPAGATDLNFQISGGKGDADLYVQFGNAPTLYSYDCRPYSDGNNEACTMPSATAGTWHVLVHGYSSFIDVNLVGNYTEGPPP